MNKKILCIALVLIMILSLFAGCKKDDEQPQPNAAITPNHKNIDEQINLMISQMSIEEKAGQMVQAADYSINPSDVRKYGLGSVLTGGTGYPGNGSQKDWNKYITSLQDAALSSSAGIPLMYGIDSVHGHAHVQNPTIFPHNIGLGAANDPELMYKMGAAIAEEMKATSIYWNFGPCVACALDPRWGRTYESFSSDPNITAELSAPVALAFQESGVAACAKHYIGDGGTTYGTSQTNGPSGRYAIDQGDVQMTENELRSAFMEPYKQLIEDGVYTVMVSFSSFNSLKMHENKYLLTDVLKGELGFNGLLISDWEGHHQINAETYEEKVALAINSGIDMLMEPAYWKEAIDAIIAGEQSGNIGMERIDDAVYRILWVKHQVGLFENPYPDTNYEIRSDESIAIAEELVEKSCVLLKNDNDLLPLKVGIKVFVTGPASNNIGVQCGGWTKTWQGTVDYSSKVTEGTTLLEGLEALASNKSIEIITDETRITECDIVLIAIGEKPYAEGEGDSPDISLTGKTALAENSDAIELAKQSNLPTITVIMAGRNVIISEYIDDWDSVIMAYLPGTEGQGMANVIMGEAEFTGKLAMPWYKSVDDIEKDNPELLFEIGYGLTAN